MYKHTLLLITAFFIISCKGNKGDLKRSSEDVNWGDSQYELVITDTIHVPFLAVNLKLYDTSPDKTRHLIMSDYESYSFAVIDNEGKVLATHKPTGQGEELVGEFIFSLGFIGNDKVVVNSSNGYFIYDALSGAFIDSYKEKTALKGFGGFYSLNVEYFERDGALHFASFLKGTLDNKNLMKFSKSYLDDYQPVTFMNTSNENISTHFGIAPTSRYRRYNYHYEQLYTMFEYCRERGQFVILNNPSDELTIWNKESELIKEIPFRLEHFKLPFHTRYNHVDLDDASDIVNSKFTTLKLNEGKALICYRTGLPQDDYANLSSYAELPALFKAKMRYYTALIDIETGEVSQEFKLPKTALGLAAFNGMDDVWLYATDELETESTTAFYRAKIKLVE